MLYGDVFTLYFSGNRFWWCAGAGRQASSSQSFILPSCKKWLVQSVHCTLYIVQGARNTRPCLTGHSIYNRIQQTNLIGYIKFGFLLVKDNINHNRRHECSLHFPARKSILNIIKQGDDPRKKRDG